MFKKPFHVKTNSAIKTSEVRKLRANVLQAYPCVSAEQLDAVLPVKGEVRLAKLQTSADGIVQCYVVNSVPLFFSTKDGPLIPTVYALWQLPACIPTLSTNAFVAKKVVGGADLMLPGVAVPRDSVHRLPTLTVGAPVAINDCSTPVYGAFAVGKILKSNRDIQFDGMNGKGVAVLHYVTDHLWEFGPKTQPPTSITREHTQWTSVDGNSDSGDTSADTDTNAVTNAMNTTHLSNEGDTAITPSDTHTLQSDEQDHHTETPTDTPTNARDTLSAEDALRYAFLSSLKTSAKNDSVLPVLVSAFYGSHMVPARIPGTEGLDIKGSKYKKIGKFLQEMEKEGIITLKEQSKGVSIITSINRNHEALTHHRVIKSSAVNEGADTSTGGKRGSSAVTDVYRPSEVLSFLFETKHDIKRTYVTDRQMRQLIDKYAESNACVSKTNPRMLICDPWLGKLTNQLEIARDEITKLALQKCQKYHQVTAADGSSAIRKGAFKPVEIIIEKRMGTKMVTLIRNLKLFEIPMATFVKEISNAMASSATVQPNPSAAGNEQEILVQGNASTQAIKLLSENYGVDKKHVSITNKVGAKGKKKK